MAFDTTIWYTNTSVKKVGELYDLYVKGQKEPVATGLTREEMAKRRREIELSKKKKY
jgi:hypothetical protein